jgi:hypothetical protein
VGIGVVLLSGFGWALLLPLAGRFGFLGILVGLGLGYLVGEAVAFAFNRKRATLLAVVAGLSLVLGFLMAAGFRAWLAQLQAGRPIDPLAPVASILPSLLGLLLNPFTLITVILAVVLAVSRVR